MNAAARRLASELAKLGAQVWMTGADPLVFADVGPAGEMFEVADGAITARK